MGNNEMQDILERMDGTYQNAPKFGASVPDGTYHMQLLEASCGMSKNDKFMVKRRHLIIGGEHDGRHVFDNMVLAEGNEIGMSFFKRWVELMGFTCPDSAVGIPDVVEKIQNENPQVIATVITNKDGFTNVRVAELEETGPPSKPKAPVTDDSSEEYAEGDTVQFNDDDGNEVSGTITGFGDHGAEVLDGDGFVWTVEVTDLSPAEEAEEAEEEEAEVTTKPKTKKKEKGKAGKSDDDKLLVKLLAFAEDQEVDEGLDDTMSLDDVKAHIDEYQWSAKTLESDAIALLKSAGIAVGK